MKYLKLIISPSAFIDELGDKRPSITLIFSMWSLVFLTLALPEIIGTIKTSVFVIPILILFLILFYFPVVYGFSYALWITSRVIKGKSKFIEIRNLFVFSMVPYILYLPISLTFIIIGIVNSDSEMITHENYITQVILWILSFRILITGIAKYNKFNWALALVNWLSVVLVIGGIYYLIKH